MRGLIYKEFSIFYKSIEKKLIIISGVFTIWLLFSIGAYGGLLASIMIAMTIGMQNVSSFITDDKARWVKYQKTMPLSNFSVVASKYISVICTLGISILGSIISNILSCIISQSFDLSVLGLSIFVAVVIPIIWTGICLPLNYWFGVQPAQIIGLFIVVPVSYLISYFEDGAGFSAMTSSVSSYLLLVAIVAVVIFIISIAISVIGYARRK